MTNPSRSLEDQVHTACRELTRTGAAATFTAVAAATGISRATLYRRRDLRELIDQHRAQEGQTPTVTALAIQVDQLRQSLEAVAANVRRHEEQLRALKRT
jgi:Family of unknown function (DUF6262)